jgi:hypothetical protein
MGRRCCEGAAQRRASEEARTTAAAGHDAARGTHGSRHAWLEGQPALDLIVTLDDATGAIYSAFLVEEEGTASTFRALKEVFSEPGLPMSLYTDRGSHYFRTTKAGEIDRSHLTQVGRALEQLGVDPIGAYSPQARGRSERAFQTRPTLSSARSICPPTTPASPSIRPAKARPSPPFQASTSMRFCACRRSVRS